MSNPSINEGIINPKDVELTRLAFVPTEAEQRQLDREALCDARYGQQLAMNKDVGEARARYSVEFEMLRKRHPTLYAQDLHELWLYTTFGVPIEGFVKKQEQSSKTTAKEELSNHHVDERLLEAAKKENELRQELATLKKTHEKTVSKLEVADDVAQRDQTLERKLVQLAEAMLLVKQGNEASFKDLKRRVKKIGGASESEPSNDELLKVKEELEAQVEELKKSLDRKEAELVQQSDESKLAMGRFEVQQFMNIKVELEAKDALIERLQRSLDKNERALQLQQSELSISKNIKQGLMKVGDYLEERSQACLFIFLCVGFFWCYYITGSTMLSIYDVFMCRLILKKETRKLDFQTMILIVVWLVPFVFFG